MPHFAVQSAPAGVGSSTGVLAEAAELEDDEADSSVAYEIAASSAVVRTLENLIFVCVATLRYSSTVENEIVEEELRSEGTKLGIVTKLQC